MDSREYCNKHIFIKLTCQDSVLADRRVYDEHLGKAWKRWIGQTSVLVMRLSPDRRFNSEHAIATLMTPIAALVPRRPNVLIVGGTAGIGAALAKKLALQLPSTAHITIAGRSRDAAAAVIGFNKNRQL